MRARVRGRTADLTRRQWGTNVERHRLAMKLTQAQFAKRCSTDQSTISRLENGDLRNPSIDLMLKVAAGCGKSPDEIFGWPIGVLDIYANNEAKAS